MKFFSYLILLFVPLPLASARPFWMWFWAVLIILLALFLGAFQRRYFLRLVDPLYAVLITGCGMFVLWGVVQAFECCGGFNLTSNRSDTLATASFFFVNFLWFFVIAAYFGVGHRLPNLIRWVGIVSILYAIYGFVVFVDGNHAILWFEKWAYQESLTSTFVNRNSYAAYCGLGMQCVIADLRQLFRTPKLTNVGTRKIIGEFVADQFSRILWRLCALIFLLIVLLLTGSRAGVATVLVAVILQIYLTYFRYAAGGTRRKRVFVLALTAIGSICLISSLFNLSGSVLDGRMDKAFDVDQRFVVYPVILDAIQEKPITGYGLGTFDRNFQMLRTPDITTYFDRAHNDYLELAFTAGLPATFLLLALIFLIVRRLSLAFSSRTTSEHYSILGLTTTLQLGLHSMVDFSLQMPAISLTYLAILGSCFGSAILASSTEPKVDN